MKRKNIVLAGIVIFVALVLVIFIVINSRPKTYNSNTINGANVEHISNVDVEITTQIHKTEVPDGYIGIYTVDDFEYIRTNPSYNYILMNDLDFSDVTDWKSPNIKSMFDGNNYSIMNFMQNTSLFSVCYGTIQNLNMQNIEISGKSILCRELSAYYHDDENHLYPGTLKNCNIEGKINYAVTDAESDVVNVGGIISYAKGDPSNSEISPIIDDCIFNGTISVTYAFDNYFQNNSTHLLIGGIVGFIDEGTISNCITGGKITYNETNMENNWDNLLANIGGIAGSTGYGTIENTKNEINIVSNSESINAAGIVGLVGKQLKSTVISGCCNLGNITLQEKYSGSVIDSSIKAGGIIANYDYPYLPTIYNCYNSGSITANNVGGLSCCSANLKFCYNIGEIKGTNKAGALLCDKNENIEYCYSLNNGVDVTSDGGKYPYVKVLSEEEMKNQSSFEWLNFNDVWTFSDGEYKYPTLKNCQ